MSSRYQMTESQTKLARRIEQANITTYSQIVKAFERREDEKIAAWKAALRRYDAEHGRIW